MADTTQEKKTNKGGISETDLKDLKSKYGTRLKCASIEDLEEPKKRYYYYFEEPDKEVWGRATAHVFEKNLKAAKETFHSHCIKWEEPDLLAVKNREKYILGIGTFIGDTFKLPESRLEDF